ncbi:precorrin-2 C(20)-methyltransferase [Salidesulfovibrio onnuriiensis]|uniref:precorrin-2 C(20)-methyltransferase n=1 Tax=Salidesulfovibrio onnuriiensis TaxID=2583823 RepID=UPI0011C720CA|nr:precorrin-2 C(20)-methyltransferase [Salidesulfovibrio onnuriiensis]
MTQPGKLYGIGVGPGDPDLLTIKAAKVLGQVDVVFAAASTKNDYSTALGIARPHMREDVEVRKLGFPMTKDKTELQAAWDRNAEEVAEVLRSGRQAAFLTLGDSLTYSTYGYLLNTLKRLDPTLPCEAVPGITSYQAAAARVGFILAESEESLVVSSGVCSPERLEQLLDVADNAVIMKTYKNFTDIRDSLEKLRLSEKTVLVSRLGMEGESILHDIRDAPEKPHYFSLALVRKNPHD